jgi:hypothetical protein
MAAGAVQPVGLVEAAGAADVLAEAGSVADARVTVPEQAKRAPGEVVALEGASPGVTLLDAQPRAVVVGAEAGGAAFLDYAQAVIVIPEEAAQSSFIQAYSAIKPA